MHAVPSFKTRSSKIGLVRWLLGCLAVVLSLVCLYYIFSEDASTPIEDPLKSITVREIEIRSQFFEQAENSTVVTNSDYSQVKPVLAEELPQPIRITRDRFKKVVTKTFETIEAAPFNESDESQNLPYRVDLSSEMQKEIPQFNFAGHTYADDPQRRMIIINNQILREGDSVDSETTLVNIVWEGVILNYKGVLFKQKINRD